MRLPYVPDPPTGLSKEDEQVVERIRARRAPRPLTPLDLALLHSPKFADGWNSMLGAVRTKGILPDDLREIAILRPAIINEAWFEWGHHWPLLLEAPGVTEENVMKVKELNPTSQGELNDKQWAVLRYADEMTRNVNIPQPVFDNLKAVGFSQQEIVELTITVAAYNMASRFLVAMNVDEQNGKKPDLKSKATN